MKPDTPQVAAYPPQVDPEGEEMSADKNVDSWAPPPLYVWDVLTSAGEHRAGGVSGGRARAVVVLGEALLEAPRGSRGAVQRVKLPLRPSAGYRYGKVVASGWTDAVTGALSWEE